MALSFTVKFDLDTKKYIFTDTTVYSSVAGVSGELVVTDPLGTVHPTETLDVEAGDRVLEVDLALDASDDILTGAWEFQYDADSQTTKVNTYTYAVLAFPTIDIDISQECQTSILTSEDKTNYALSGQTLVFSRRHVIIVPDDSSLVDVVVNDSSSNIDPIAQVGPNMWTGMYAVTITTEVQYTSTVDGLIVFKTLSQSDSHTVECNDCMCGLSQCIANLWTRYQEALGTNYKQAESLRQKVMNVVGNYMLWQINTDCGNYDVAVTYCEAIQDIVISEDCACENPDGSYEVIPIFTSSGSGGSGVTYSVVAGTGINVATTGTNPVEFTVSINANINELNDVTGTATSDFHVLKWNTTTSKYEPAQLAIGQLGGVNLGSTTLGEVLYWDGGNFINYTIGLTDLSDIVLTSLADKNLLQYDIASGKFINVTPAEVFPFMLFSDSTDEGNTATATTIYPTGKTYTIPANLLNVGDQLDIELSYQITHQTGYLEWFSVYLNSGTLLVQWVVGSGALLTGTLRARVNILASNFARIESDAELSYTPSVRRVPLVFDVAFDPSTTNTIDAAVEATSAVANAVVVKSMTIKSNKKA